MGRDETFQSCNTHPSAPLQQRPEAPDGPVDSLLCGILGNPQARANLQQRLILEEAEKNGGTILLRDRLHGLIKERGDGGPIFRSERTVRRFHGDLFPGHPPRFPTNQVNGSPASYLIEPRGHQGARLKAMSTSRQIDKDTLGHFLGEVGRAHLAQCGGINQVQGACRPTPKRHPQRRSSHTLEGVPDRKRSLLKRNRHPAE